MKRVFVTGSERGQLYWELARTKPATMQSIAWPEKLDICDREAVDDVLLKTQPDVIINAAAFTAVDKAELDSEKAYAVNQSAIENLALAATRIDAKLIHVSTDFVFGQGDGRPFQPNAAVDPVSVYGKSKLAGEKVLQRLMPERSLVVRTAWLYSSHGDNFVKTMLRLMSERDELGVVADQIGSPTWAHSLATALWRAAALDVHGTLHWTGAGVASWYDFAVAIFEEATTLGIVDRSLTIKPLTTEQYPTPATRPAYSVLALRSSWNQLDMSASHWRADLRLMLQELL